MHPFLKPLAVLLLGAVFVSCLSSCDSKNDDLKPGTFKTKTTGAFEGKLSGKATFTLDPSTNTNNERYFHLDLKAGQMPVVIDSIATDYGIFLTVPWNSTGILELENSFISNLYISPNSPFPYFPHILSSGSIMIESYSQDLISGEINLSDSLAFPDSGFIEIKGKFKAIPSENQL